jgi:hypothetical protein
LRRSRRGRLAGTKAYRKEEREDHVSLQSEAYPYFGRAVRLRTPGSV